MFSLFIQRNNHFKQSIHLIIFCFFLYKLTETILQYGTRIEIYKLICLSLINSTKLQQIICSDEINPNNYNDSIENQLLLNHIQRLSGYYLLIYRILLNLPATIACFIYGIYSNKYGYKISMLIPCLGAIIACTLFSISLLLLNHNLINYSIIFILIGGFIYGICGKSSAITMGANSYITNLTHINNRTSMLGRLLGVNCLGLSIGTLLLGIFLTFFNYSDLIIFCTINNFFIVLILLFMVIDTNNNENIPILNDHSTLIQSNNDNEKSINCINSMKLSNYHYHYHRNSFNELIQLIIKQFNQSYQFLFHNNFNEKHQLLLILLFTVLFNQMTKSGEQDIILLYLHNEPILWSNQLYSYYITCYYGCMFIHLIFILPIIEKFYSLHDTTLIIIGLLLKIIRLLLFHITKYNEWLFFGAIIGSASGYITSSTRSIISKLIYKTEIGASFALISIFETIANLFGGLLFTLIYNYTITIMSSFIFILDAFLHSLILILFIWLRFKLILFENNSNIEQNNQ
ncbi:unnamed protein product [Schistosoma margrebowiei]|uniref:Uncharacterized protein n=1 Tax=Schistosoma margrebowiei TaxID=48269 RepID=A0A183L9Q9_9TREM|nr:unnamed protein product [Schistosoma margrebowiei]